MESALYLLFGFGAILAAELAPQAAFSRCGLLLVCRSIVVFGNDAAQPSHPGRLEREWDKWLLQLSPWAISLQFGLGVVTYHLFRRPLSERRARPPAILAVPALLPCTHWLERASGRLSLLAAVATAFLMIGALSESITNRFLSSRPMVYIGTILYSLYLFHFLTPGMANARSFDVYNGTAMAYHAGNFLTSLFITIVFSTGMYRSSRFRRGALFAWPPIACLGFNARPR